MTFDVASLKLQADGTTWSVKQSQDVDAKEGGSKLQTKLTLQSSDGSKKYVRLKKSRSINEAITYFKMNSTRKASPEKASQEPLQKHIPHFLGAVNAEGKEIDIGKELRSFSMADLVKQHPHVYIILEDLCSSEDAADGVPKDFKFVHKTLRINARKWALHRKNKKHSFFYHIFKTLVFAFSRCSFAFLGEKVKSTSLFTRIASLAKRFFSILETKSELQGQLEKLTPEQLEEKISELKALEADVSQSDFTCSDASLLFVPSKTSGFNIRLIDLEYGIHRSELLEDEDSFSNMRQAMRDSIHEITELATRILSSRKRVPC
jgi:hypothetical protein